MGREAELARIVSHLADTLAVNMLGSKDGDAFLRLAHMAKLEAIAHSKDFGSGLKKVVMRSTDAAYRNTI